MLTHLKGCPSHYGGSCNCMNEKRTWPTRSDPYVRCEVCGRDKSPRGRSVPFGVVMCDWECPGYNDEPLSSQYWPGEMDDYLEEEDRE